MHMLGKVYGGLPHILPTALKKKKENEHVIIAYLRVFYFINDIFGNKNWIIVDYVRHWPATCYKAIK